LRASFAQRSWPSPESTVTTHPHLQRIGATPRPVGSEANQRARQYCADHLRSLGFVVTERPFEFSALPGRHAAQIIGAVSFVGFGISMVLLGDRIRVVTVLAVLLLVVLLGRRSATRGSWMREAAVNLEARRGAQPRLWLVAHIDSKSQPISSALRTVGVTCVLFATVGVFFVLPLGLLGAPFGIVGGAILMLASVGAASDGAADNASGVAAVLDAAALIPASVSLGVLITDAEELALAGATAWVVGRPAGIALNCDTIDDIGRLTLFEYGYMSNALDERAGPAARAIDPTARVMRPLPGVLTDSNAFHRAGWATVTLSRGTIRTLNRIHTKRDSLDSLRGTGIPDAARVLARIAEELA
jgi:hypothetical protein